MIRLRAAWVVAACLAAAVGLGTGVLGANVVRIINLAVADLSPLEISFDVENSGSTPLLGVRGDATLSEARGAPIDRFSISSFDVAVGETVHVRTASRWELELAGPYLLDVALDAGGGALITASLPFEILPIRLPSDATTRPASGIQTLVQEPASWGLDRIGSRAAWATTYGAPSVVVAVIDSGIDSRVPQLADAMWVNEDEIPGNGIDDDGNDYIDDVNGWDFRDNDASSLFGSPIYSHGTGVASIIAARPGRYPVVGVAPGVKLMDVRFLDSANKFSSSDWKTFGRAIGYAVDNGADIINLSIFANGKPPASFEQAIANARARGVIVVGITGNLGQGELMYPGRYDTVLAVSGTSEAGLLAAFSNYGSGVDLCAPGEAIATLAVGPRVVSENGTSFAAPHVAGVLALMLSANPRLTPDRAIALLESTAIDLGPPGWDEQYGYGLVDAAAAVDAARGT